MKNNDTMTPKMLAYVLVGILFVMAVALLVRDVPQGNKELFGTVLQTILTLAGAAVFFHVGSSSGSRNKDRPSIDPEAGPIHTTQVETTKVETETRQEVKPPATTQEVKP